MTGYVRKDTTNNIADGNVINAADLDAEFDGVQDAFNASTGHKHDGTAGEGATINALGPTQDVTISSTLLAPKTTNTVDIGSSSLKFKDLFLAGNGSVGGTLAVTGVATFTAQPILSSLTASRAVFSDGSKGLVSNAITGTGNVVMSASPTLTGTAGFENITASGTLGVTGVATFTAQPIVSSLTASRAVFSDGSKGLVSNAITGTGNVVMSASPTLTGTISAEALTASSSVTLSGGTANGVAYLNGSKVLTSGSALTFDGTNLGVGIASAATKVHAVGDNVAGRGQISMQTSTAANFAQLTFYDRTTLGAQIYQGYQATAGVGDLTIQTSNASSSLVFGTNSTEGMRLTSTGLGIGTSSPAYKLHAVKTGGGIVGRFDNADGVADIYGYGLEVTRSIAYIKGSGALHLGSAAGYSAVVLDSAGNLGLGVTPSAWRSGTPAFQIGSAGFCAFADSGITAELGNNVFLNSSSQYIYLRTDAASRYRQYQGVHSWLTAGSGTAGDAVSFSTVMTLDASGNLGVGTTSPAAKLDVRLAASNGGDVINIGNINGSVYGGLGIVAASPYSVELFGTVLTFRTGGNTTGSSTERARIDSSGNLGLGVTPSAWGSAYKALQVSNAALSGRLAGNELSLINNGFHDGSVQKYINTNFATGYTQQYGQHQWFTAPSGTAGDAISFTQAMTLDASGNLGVGVTSPSARVDVRGAATDFAGLNVINSESSSGVQTTASIRLGITNSIGVRNTRITAIENNTDSNSVNLAFFTNEANALNSEVERARITSDGNLLVGTTSAGGNGLSILPFASAGSTTQINFNRTASSTTGYPIVFQNGGADVGYISHNNTATAYVTSSDYRLKNSVAPMTGALAKVALLKPVTYKWNVDGSDGEGFIAHELAEVVPQCVTGEKDAVDEDGNPKYQGIDTSFLVATLTAALQELNAKFDAYVASHP